MKRLLTVTLVSALMAGSLVGCGGSSTTEEPAADTSQEQTAEKDEHDHDHESEEKSEEKEDSSEEEAADEDKDLVGWSGDWKNIETYEDSPKVAEAFEKLAEKEGTTAEEEKTKFEEKRRTDFNAMTIEGNTITIYDNLKADGGKELGKGNYKYLGQEKRTSDGHDLTWEIFEAEDESAPYKYFLMMEVHGHEELKHFHFRYGDESVDELLGKEGWFPTMVDGDSTEEQVAEEIAE